MINFRYHIVSLTAVLLALGVGLALGTAFLDDATVDVLRGQLDGLESDLADTRSQAAELRSQVDLLEQEHETLDGQLGARLLAGRLPAQPVLVIALDGVDGEVTARVVDAVDETDAELLGVWRLTERLALEDEGAVEDLGDALNLTSVNANRLRRDLVVRLAGILDGATEAPGVPNADQGPGTVGERTEPDLLERLHERGFVEYDTPEGSEDDAIALPAGGARLVVVTGPGEETYGDLLVQLLRELVSEGPAPVLMASQTIGDDEEDGEGDDPDDRPLIVQVRDHEELTERMSTVDNLDRVAGKVALVLALEDAAPGETRTGHYGSEDGAEDLLPPPEGDE